MTTISVIESPTGDSVQDHLILVMHSHQCLKREQQPINTSNNHQISREDVCTVPHCGRMRNVLQHMTQCNNRRNCSFPDCFQSRSLILHWKNCSTLNCSICSPSRKASTVECIYKNLLNILRVNDRSLTSAQRAKIKELTGKTENDAFGAAIDLSDYYKRVMNHVAMIRKTCVKTRLLRKQQVLTAISAPSDEQGSSNNIAETKPSIVNLHQPTASNTSSNDYSISTTTTEINKKERNEYPAVFSIDEIRQKMTPILRDLHNHDEDAWFHLPVKEENAPGYFDIIKHPMDFSTISTKLEENQYTTPFQFCEDMWLVFNNTWTYNKKGTAVYKAAQKLADLFMERVDPIMKEFGYCCGRQYVFLPPTMLCQTSDCRIRRDGDYFVYDNLSGDQYRFCKKCFDSVKSDYISVNDDLTQSLVKLPKAEFRSAKNNHQEPEAMIDCTVCLRRFHQICVLYHECIWPQGYVCEACARTRNSKRKANRNLAHELPTNDLSNKLEERVNTFLRKECGPNTTGRITIRVLAANDRVCEVKPIFKKHVGSQVPDRYPYRTKAIFAFQEIKGVDVALFGMHVQEYDSRCPGPNAKRVYISYLDSVNYFEPKDKRTAFYYELLIGYLEYVKQLGFTYAHIWACPPKKDDDYIFYCHPEKQLLPGSERLQKWYEELFKIAKRRGVVADYQNIQDYAEKNISNVTDVPYFDDDHWPNMIEDSLKEIETTTSFNDSTATNKRFKNATGGYQIALEKNRNNSLLDKIKLDMKNRRKAFFVVRLRDDSSSRSTTCTDPNPLIQCDLIESRDAFLNFAYNNHCEFSTLRRAKYSTMFLLMELQSSAADRIPYTCNICNQPCNIRYHCKTCEDYDLCTQCYTTANHEHRMERSDEANETTNSTVNNCASAKWLMEHIKICTKRPRKQCVYCMKLLTPIWTHAKACTNQNCPVPYCAWFKNKLPKQRMEMGRQT